MRHSAAISPKPRMPISSTITSVSSGVLRIVVGRPCSLLKLRSFAAVRRLAASAAHARSLVLVLPTDPVMPITVPPNGSPHCRTEVHQRSQRVGDLDRRAIRRGT